MFIRALTILLAKDKNGHSPIYPGKTVEVGDEIGCEFVALKVAKEVRATEAETGIPAAAAGKRSGNASGAENAQNSPKNAATVKGYLDGNDLNGMSFADLKALAKDMGIDTGKIRSKSGMIEAITSVEVEAPLNEDEDLPDLTPQDVVEE